MAEQVAAPVPAPCTNANDPAPNQAKRVLLVTAGADAAALVGALDDAREPALSVECSAHVPADVAPYLCAVVDFRRAGAPAVAELRASLGTLPLVALTADEVTAVDVLEAGADRAVADTGLDPAVLARVVRLCVERVADPPGARAPMSEETARQLSAVVEASADAIFTKSLDGTILTWNGGAEQLYGWSSAEVIGEHVSLLVETERADEVDAILAAVASGDTVRALETVRRRRDGTRLDVSLTASPIFDAHGVVHAVAVVARDITDRRALERELARQALHDALTDLPNRSLLTDRLERALINAARRDTGVAVLFCDVDHFKAVNDAQGHAVGDDLLRHVAVRIADAVRAADTVARFGGDEFVVVCEDTDVVGATQVARSVAEALREPIEVAGYRQYVSVSTGIAVAPPLERSAESLLRYADAAMHDAKAHGRAQHRVFDTSLAAQSSDRLELTNDLRDALAAGQLEVHYQPQVELRSGRLVGVEALTRWTHPVRGPIPPSVFVGLAEESGFGADLDRWVLEQALRDGAALRARRLLPDNARVAVNHCAASLTNPELAEVLRALADRYRLPLGVIDLEVTETGLMADASVARRVAESLRAEGVGVALDDFGTGYSSLTYLRQLPVTTLKIDVAFVRNVVDRPDDLAICASIVELARAVGMTTVAEGIETREQLVILERLGCHAGQGYLWAPALSFDDLAELLQAHPGGFEPAGAIGPQRRRTPKSVRNRLDQVTNEHGLHRMLQLQRENVSLTTIAAALNAEEFRTPAGLRWHPTSVATALTAVAARQS